MKWNLYKDSKPEIGKTVLIWRAKKRIYLVAKLEIHDLTRFGGGKGNKWRSATGNPLKIDEKDQWLEFPYLTITEVYT